MTDPDLHLVRFPTTTSRTPRPGEIEGVHYQFLSTEAFRTAIATDVFFEWTEIYGHLYGTNKKLLSAARQSPRPLICVLEPEGARKIKQAAPTQTTVILIEAERKTLLSRLKTRHTDPEDLAERIARIDRELAFYPALADVRVDNAEGQLEQTLRSVKQIIQDRLKNT